MYGIIVNMENRKINRIRQMYFENNVAVEQIAAKMGYCVATIYKYLKADFETAEEFEQKTFDGIASPYESIVREWLTEDAKHYFKQRHTAKRVYDRLCEMYSDFAPSYKTILRMYKRIHAEVFSTKRQQRNLPDSPGEAEVGCLPFPCCINGHKCDAFIVSLSFPYSRAAFLQIIPERNTEWILTALQNIYAHLCGVPAVQMFMPQTKLYRYKNHDVSDITDELLMRFVMYHGFKDDYYIPHDESTPPTVSALTTYYKRHFLSGVQSIDDLSSFNAELLLKCDTLGKRIPMIDRVTTVDEFLAHDKAKLLPLPTDPFKIMAWSKRKIDKMAVLTINSKHKYALNPAMKNRTVFVYLTADKVEVRNLNQDIIATFDRIYSVDIVDAINPVHQLYLLRFKPNAILNCKLKELLSPALVTLFSSCDSRIKSRYINAMWEICSRSDLATAMSCANQAAEKSITTREGILKLYDKNYDKQNLAKTLQDKKG